MKKFPQIILLVIVLILFSCQEENKKSANLETSEETVDAEETVVVDAEENVVEDTEETVVKSDKRERERDIELLKEFWLKEKKSIKDENGFAIKYRVEAKNPAPVLLGVSDTLFSPETEEPYRKLQYVALGLQKETYSLFLDGEHIKDIDILYQVYQLFTASTRKYTESVLQDWDGDGEYAYRLQDYWDIKDDDYYGHPRLYYAPELQPIEKRNEIIGQITRNYVGQTTGLTEEQVDRLGEEVVKIVRKAVSKAEIFKYKTLKDIQDINFS